MPERPGTIYIREDILLPAITEVIAERVFGPHRRDYLAAQNNAAPRRLTQAHAETVLATRGILDDITARQDRIAAELEETPSDNTAWRAKLRQRFHHLETRRVEADAKLADLTANPPAVNTGDPALLDAMPHIDVRLADLPERLQRDLFDILNLQVRLPNTHQARIKITLTADTPRAVLDATVPAAHTPYDQATGRDNKTAKPDAMDTINRDDARLPAPATTTRQDLTAADDKVDKPPLQGLRPASAASSGPHRCISRNSRQRQLIKI